MSPDSARTWRSLLVFLSGLIAAGAAVQPEIDVDTWWHLRVGEYVAETRSVPTTDPFSQVGQSEGRPWVAYSWLYEVGLYATFRVGGLGGLPYARFLLSAAMLATLAWYLHRRAENPWAAAVAFAMAVPAVYPLLTERPWHVTIIGTLLTLHAIESVRAGEPIRRFWWLALVYVVWANVHVQFVLGLGLFGLAAGVGVLERRPVGGLIGLAAACALATLVNPYHVRLYGVIYEYATYTGALSVIAELRPPNPANWWVWPVMAMTAWAIVAVVRRRFRLWDVALLAVGVVFAARMQRDGWFGLVCAATVALHGDVPPARAAGRGAALVVLAAFAMVRGVWDFGLIAHATAADEVRKKYPADAVRAVLSHRPPGRLFNHLSSGGYLIWELRDYPVWIDGRTNLHGDARLYQHQAVWLAGPGWEDDPDLRAAGVIVAPRQILGVDTPLTKEMLDRPDRWRVLHADEVAVVFVPAR
ncbi:MAG TPA: hypothetical protein VM597_38260 [Gemmataceae bacterium]|jgi:hypothetical protein|nr:hypothetical protein [Gemmataceae bacterium]